MSMQRAALVLFDLCRFRTEAYYWCLCVYHTVFEDQNAVYLYLFLFVTVANQTWMWWTFQCSRKRSGVLFQRFTLGRKRRRLVTFADSFKVFNVIIIIKSFKKCPMVYANSKGSDQPEHPCGLILFHFHYFRPSNKIQICYLSASRNRLLK